MFEKKVLSPLEIRSGIFRIFRKAAECIFVFCCISVHTLNAQNDFPIQPVFVYTADVAANVSGGISTGIGYLGYAVAGVEFDIGKAGWWKRGSLVLTGGCTHGCEPSAQWIGDFQMADNIEAGNHVFLQELYWHQSLGPVEVTAGMQDYCMHYTFLDAAGLYLNSSFGTNSVLLSNHALPIFPILGWGLNAQWHITDCLSWQAVVSAHFRDGFLGFAHKESSVELTYRYVLNEHCYLQPDVQYILHPSAAEQTADNALFGAVRLGVEF